VSSRSNSAEYIQSGVPGFLETPITSMIQPPPPVQTLVPLLPTELLTWEDFERLCVRMARLNSGIEHSRLYGVRGQAQEGIDLFARSFTGDYTVYQCKRVESLTAADIRAAVEKFQDGSWASRASTFILCTSHAAVRTEQAEEYNKQIEFLRARNVGFVIWDKEEISHILRDQARLVHDFFGKVWLTAFLGEPAARAFQSRLEPEKVGQFRLKLSQFYQTVFVRQDPGIPISPRPGLQSIPLGQRFVPQDILVNERTPSAITDRDKEFKELGREQPASSKYHLENQRPNQPLSGTEYRTRESISVWLARTPNSVITGGPGSGKTTLLRYLALEILTEETPGDRIARFWVERLPVWIPFAFWTKQIVDDGQCNVSEAARRWLDSWNQADLWPLVEAALEDERLLLLVDGIDESANDEAARVALQMLQVFVQTHKVSALATSRPLLSLAVQGAEWQAGELAGLSESQKALLCTKWFELRNQVETQFGGPSATQDFLKQETQSFLRELAESTDLGQLSRVPMLLLLLLYLRFQNAMLPRDRFDAYSKLVDYLLREHPASRSAASQVIAGRPILRDKEVLAALAQIALHIQLSAPEGIISSDQLTNLTEQILNNPNGLDLKLPPSELREYADQFIERVQDRSGLLVRQGIDAVSFLHHSLQEYLAATQIASLPMEQVIEIIRSRALDRRWREVVLNVFWKLQRPAEIRQLIEIIEGFVAPTDSGLYVRELLTEVACSAIECPTDLARKIAADAIRQVETHGWLPHRRRMVRFLVGGLNCAKTKDVAKRAMSRWIFRSGDSRASWFEGFADWSARSDVIQALLVCLNDEDSIVQRAAAESLARVAGGDQDVGNLITDIAYSSLDPGANAAAIRALSLGWSDHPSLWSLISEATKSRSQELHLTAVWAKVRLGRREDQDWQILMDYATADFWSRASWGWTGEIVSSLATGWKSSPGLKKLCLEAERSHFDRTRQHMDWEIAQRLLLEAFPDDEDAAKYCADQIKTQQFPFLSLNPDAWKLLAKTFRDNRLISSAIDEWAPKQSHHEPELRYAAMVGRTPIVKSKLIDSIGSSSIPFWTADALLEGWGLNDSDVSKALTAVVYGQAARASGLAQFIPQIIAEPKKARERLMQLLSDPQASYPHLILRGLASLKDRGDEQEIVQRALAIRASRFIRFEEAFDSELILGFSAHQEVRAFGLRLLAGRNPPVSALANSFEHDEEIRQRLLDIIVSVPVSLRSEVVDGLARFTPDVGLALNTLGHYDAESNADLKVLGSAAFHRLLVRHQRDATSAAKVLSESIRSYGIDHEARRQAALAGILILNRLDLMNQLETIGTSRPVSVNLETHGQLNLPLLRIVAEHWAELRTTFGETLRERLSDKFSITRLEEALSVVAAEFPELQEDVWSVKDQNVSNSKNVLKLLETVKPRSEVLKLRCLGEIRRDDGTWGGIERVNFAAKILTDNFSGDEDVRTQIIGGRPAFRLSEGEIIALCAGWPNDPLVAELHEALRKKQHLGFSIFGVMAVWYASVAVEKIVAMLFQHLDTQGICNAHGYAALKGPVEGRVKRDSEVRLAFHKALRTGATASGKATFPRLLVRTEGLTTELHEWVEGELTRQLSRKTVPEAGFDLVEGRARSVASSLLDALDS
jgi:hypothetical protein